MWLYIIPIGIGFVPWIFGDKLNKPTKFLISVFLVFICIIAYKQLIPSESSDASDGNSIGGISENGNGLGGDDNVTVSSISLDRNSLTIMVGEKVTLRPTINPSNATDQSVLWSSDDSSIASVNNGVIIAESVGSTTITAMIEDKSASCLVAIYEPPLSNDVPLTELTVVSKSGGNDPWTAGTTGDSIVIREKINNLFGDVYRNCYTISVAGEPIMYGYKDAYIEFLLNGEYSTFDVTLSCWDGEQNDDFYVVIETDDKVIYKSSSINKKTKPIELIGLDVSGQVYLRITKLPIDSMNVLILGNAVVHK